ncbi:MAG: DNA internalization-related competence protein ComEC/Rec2 [Nitrospirae bacterium]|nr:DNA internalization-related competence protein ComEC/Rec2 [Nitrospirota bacterium]
MISAAASFICGIAAENSFSFFPVSIGVLFVSAITFLLLTRRKNKKRIFFAIAVFAFGFLYSFMRHEALSEVKFPDSEVSVEGSVADVPETSNEKTRFTLEDVYVQGRPVHGRVRLAVSPDNFIPSYGDRVSSIAKLKEPKVLHNPGIIAYDPKKDGIIATGYVSNNVRKIRSGTGFLAWLSLKREKLGRIIDNSLSPDSAAFQKAIILGLQRGISQDIRDSFSTTGLTHIISISGTHFALLAFIIFKIVKTSVKLLPAGFLTKMTLYITPTQAAVITTLPVLFLYAFISGASTPTIRSFIMIFIYMLALFLGRKGQWLNSLSIAAVIILLWQPDALFELSFQLSFVAVLSIGYVVGKEETDNSDQKDQDPLADLKELSEGERPLFQRLLFKKIGTAMLITIAAVLGTAPLTAVYFKQFPLISPLSNLIVTPFICFIMLPVGFFTGFGALLFNLPIMPLNTLTDAMTHFAFYLADILSHVPFANLHVPGPSFVVMALYYLSLIFVIKSKAKWRLLPIIIVIGLYLAGPLLYKENFRITFIDVGQGDSSLIELPDKRVMLVDGGTYEPDMGQRAVAPYLWSKGIRKIDYLVLSHAHPDHFGGLIYIMDNFRVGEIWLNGKKALEIDTFSKKMQEKRIPSKILKRGDVLEAENYKIYVLHPYNEFYAGSSRGEFSDQNSSSLVLKIESNEAAILLTGDIENNAEEDLIHLGKWLKSDILKVPHHGGRTSSSDEFLMSVSPKVAVASVGKANSFNHPHEETIERYKYAGIRLYRTDMDGAVTVTAKDGSYEIKTYWDSTFKEVKGLRDEMENLKLLF